MENVLYIYIYIFLDTLHYISSYKISVMLHSCNINLAVLFWPVSVHVIVNHPLEVIIDSLSSSWLMSCLHRCSESSRSRAASKCVLRRDRKFEQWSFFAIVLTLFWTFESCELVTQHAAIDGFSYIWVCTDRPHFGLELTTLVFKQVSHHSSQRNTAESGFSHLENLRLRAVFVKTLISVGSSLVMPV